MGISNLYTIAGMIFFPFIVAVILALVKNDRARKIIVYVSAALIVATVVLFSTDFLIGGQSLTYLVHTETIDRIMLGGEFILMGLIIWMSIRYKKILAAILSLVQTGGLAWLELSGYTEKFALNHIYCDRLTIVMLMMIGIVGSLICVYATGYMRDYHHHHTEFADRRRFFFAMLFVFLGAMFGLVFSANLIWIYFFWEITSVSSFLLIGYTKTEDAIYNSFRALWMNLLGGLGFAVAIIYAVIQLQVINLEQLVNLDSRFVIIPVMLLAFAGMTKSAQLPFSKWLMGAMVAPTPTSALLHSATMVKAGVYLLIRLAPAMEGNAAGYTVALIGGFTFFFTSIRAIVHSDGKKILAYSTISNLGLITACAGIGYAKTVWAAIFLMMFHSVSKSLLFQSVGAIENATGSRDVEDMHGLIKRHPGLAAIMVIGIAGMFLAPFGMLISKWAALKAFVDAGNVALVLCLAFGSATTMFYWTKWILKLVAWSEKTVTHRNTTPKCIWVSLWGHAAIMIALVFLYPLISKYFVQHILDGMYGYVVPQVIGTADLIIMVIMVFAVLGTPVIAWLATRNAKVRVSKAYMSGINRDEGRKFIDANGEEKETYLANWYMLEIFSSMKILNGATILAGICLLVGMAVAIGGVFF